MPENSIKATNFDLHVPLFVINHLANHLALCRFHCCFKKSLIGVFIETLLNLANELGISFSNDLVPALI